MKTRVVIAVFLVAQALLTLTSAGTELETYGLTGEGVTVAIIDTGLNVDDLPRQVRSVPGRFYYWWEEADGRYLIYPGPKRCNYYSNDDTTDDIGHGTMMVSIITELAPNVTILPVKCFTSLPGYGECSNSNLISGIDYAVEHGADIICMSFGTEANYASVRAAVQRAIDAGCVLVAGVGNKGNSILQYPAAYDGVIGVGATDGQGNAASYSQKNESVDIYAPGIFRQKGNGKVSVWTGTSFSNATVVGAAALALETRPDLTGNELLALLQGSADPVDGQTAGALNVERLAGALVGKEVLPCGDT